MSEERYSFDNPMHITIEQSKLVANALRTQIIEVIGEVPHTAKQVADALKKTPGNVHYHIQRLYEGGLIDLVETREVGGVVEKYYKAKSTYFTTDPIDGKGKDPNLSELPHYNVKYSSSTRTFGRVLLSEDEKRELSRKFYDICSEYAKRPDDPEIERAEYAIAVEMLKVLQPEEDSEAEIIKEEHHLFEDTKTGSRENIIEDTTKQNAEEGEHDK